MARSVYQEYPRSANGTRSNWILHAEETSPTNTAPSDEFGPIIEAIAQRLDEINAARDRALVEVRQIVRLCANAIRAVHRHELNAADSLLAEAGTRLTALSTALAPFPNLYWAGYVQDALKEYAEARILRAVVADEPVPSPTDLAVEDAAYLNGLAEAASELRRHILDLLRSGDAATVESLLARMDAIYSVLITVDYPEATTGGLRRTTDQLRPVLERTRGDVTLALQQQRLERALKSASGRAGHQEQD